MSFQNLYRSSPSELKQIIMDQWKAKQTPSHHPEGNTLKHIIVVTNRAFRDFPDSKDIQLAAYFHDLGKLATYDINPKTGQPTAYGHEAESAKLIDKFSNFIEQQGANPEIVKYIVVNHMKIKPSTWDVMKPAKKDPIVNDPNYQDLEKFGTIDKGGLLEFKYLLQNNKKMPQLINEAKRFQKLANIKEAEENQSIDSKIAMDAEKKAFQVANSSEFNAAMEKEWAKLSDEDRKKLAQSLSSLNEAMGGDFSSFQKIVQKSKDVEGINEDMSDVKTAVGNVLGHIGKLNALSLFIPGALTTMKLVGWGAFGLAPAMIGSLVGSMILWWLGKKIADSGNGADEFLNETVNEALAKFRKDK